MGAVKIKGTSEGSNRFAQRGLRKGLRSSSLSSSDREGIRRLREFEWWSGGLEILEERSKADQQLVWVFGFEPCGMAGRRR
ncbi:unnamed protein product [Lactuca virosa]|uniref:Uncharacterized protein n=1 Tax=Lactuca virosa TaxID=75947 RepID=A0AAU9N9Y7_9ASTR|nr:unnamed protein product [Lactuca virosa]